MKYFFLAVCMSALAFAPLGDIAAQEQGANARSVTDLVPESGGTPFPYEQTALRFDEEVVLYRIGDGQYAAVTATYRFSNPTDTYLTAALALPFSHEVPADLRITDGTTDIPYAPDDAEQGTAALFVAVASPEETITLTATYSLWFPFFSNMMTDSYQCRYNATSALVWGDAPQTATFTLIMPKTMYFTGLDGFTLTHNDTHLTAVTALSPALLDVCWIAIGDVILVLAGTAMVFGVLYALWAQARQRNTK